MCANLVRADYEVTARGRA